ncbi:hypothetical protein DSM16313_23280 [Acinetobacter seohaensis]|nr:hypothetical protein DSM16313_23280 [Acinetobacter seohaensis]
MNAFIGQTFQMNQLISIKQVVEFVGVGRSVNGILKLPPFTLQMAK